MKRRAGGRYRNDGTGSDGSGTGGTQVPPVHAPPAPQAGLDKWLVYAETVGVTVPEEIREDKAAVRALLADKTK